jgi:hypothetical protein
MGYFLLPDRNKTPTATIHNPPSNDAFFVVGCGDVVGTGTVVTGVSLEGVGEMMVMVGVGVSVTVGSGTEVTGSRDVTTSMDTGIPRLRIVSWSPRLSLSTDRGFSTWTE